ncbi:MAG: energy-coupling factor transporter ATPase [Clostridia bacterium]|nr:energy-coupling factor transporter ATPase [Clostridia bacterium]
MAIISVQDLTFNYTESGFPALSNVSLEIEKGEFLAIVGHNGSGKSTLAKHFNGLLTPTSGKVYVCGMDTADENNSLDIKRHVGMVFQNPDNQIVTTVVEDDVAFGPENLGVPSDEIRKRVDEALVSVGMKKYAQAAPHMLSGGQKQRIAIAGMLAMHPDILVLDEATAMLDPMGRREITDIARKLNKENGITVIMITQHMDEVTYADRVVVMKNGKIEFEGDPKRVFSQSARLTGAGLDVPPAVALRNKLICEHALAPTNAVDTEEITDDIYREFVKRGIV